MTSTSMKLVNLPGFGMPLNARDALTYSLSRTDVTYRHNKTEKFPIALIDEGYEAPVLPTREYAIMRLVNTITDKSDWQHKVFDDAIVARWQAEVDESNSSKDTPETTMTASSEEEVTDMTLTESRSNAEDAENESSQRPVDDTRLHMTPRMFAWAISEVKHKAILFEIIDCVEALDGVWKSDTIIGQDLRKALEKAVRPLEDVPKEERDWHPGSNHQVLDLVHPSIYPLVYGQSRLLQYLSCHVENCTSWIGKGFTPQSPVNQAPLGDEWSKKFQWLPTEFEAPPDVGDVHTTSYINNLHPEHHRHLYSIIEQVVSKAIPLWDRVLSHLIMPPIEPRVSDWTNSNFGYGEGAYGEPNWSDAEAEGEDDMPDEARFEAWQGTRPIIEPEPGEFKSKAERIRANKKEVDLSQRPEFDAIPLVNLRRDYGQLQIIIKLANIHLTPEHPDYPGGSWHVEGQANESICASALYYYSNHNVTESYLSFRQQTEDGALSVAYEQDDHRAAEYIYGIKIGEPAVQDLGEVLTRESRLLCFPNVMQHRVSSFKLADPSKPGHRKLLALFLVDPHIKIISTENVPPQQKSWWKENVMGTGVFQRLPPELAENVLSSVDFPITLEEAREQRLELMEERKNFCYHADDLIESKTFSLCEH